MKLKKWWRGRIFLAEDAGELVEVPEKELDLLVVADFDKWMFDPAYEEGLRRATAAWAKRRQRPAAIVIQREVAADGFAWKTLLTDIPESALPDVLAMFDSTGAVEDLSMNDAFPLWGES